jgi:hypothetical protein
MMKLLVMYVSMERINNLLIQFHLRRILPSVHTHTHTKSNKQCILDYPGAAYSVCGLSVRFTEYLIHKIAHYKHITHRIFDS